MGLFRMIIVRQAIAAFLACMVFGAPVPAQNGRAYEFVLIDALPDDKGSTAKGINAFAEAVGYTYSDAEAYRAFLWEIEKSCAACDYNSIMIDLGTLGASYTRAYGINDLKQVVGYSYNAQGFSRAFLWEEGVMTDLGALGSGLWSAAFSINNAGQVVGYAYTSDQWNAYHAFLWQEAKTCVQCGNEGVMIDLGTLGGDHSVAFVINDPGQVVGRSEILSGSSRYHAFLWERVRTCVQCGTEERMTDLGTLGGDHSDAWGLNDLGQVVGWSEVIPGDPAFHAFLWEDGVMTDLGTLGGELSEARAVNNPGQVVGYSRTQTDDPRACLWEGDKIIDLNDLLPSGVGWELIFANDINDEGCIVGTAFNGEESQAFLLIPGPALQKAPTF